MIPQPGQYVKIIFNNATQAEGFVENWSDDETVLKAEDGKSYLVISKTSDHVMAVKIMIDYDLPQRTTTKLEELAEKFEEVKNLPSSDELRLKKLGQLRIMMADQEKKMFANKMAEHKPSSDNAAGVKYGNPFTKK